MEVNKTYECTTEIEGYLTVGKQYEGDRNEHGQLVVTTDDRIQRAVRSMYFKEVSK